MKPRSILKYATIFCSTVLVASSVLAPSPGIAAPPKVVDLGEPVDSQSHIDTDDRDPGKSCAYNRDREAIEGEAKKLLAQAVQHEEHARNIHAPVRRAVDARTRAEIDKLRSDAQELLNQAGNRQKEVSQLPDGAAAWQGNQQILELQADAHQKFAQAYQLEGEMRERQRSLSESKRKRAASRRVFAKIYTSTADGIDNKRQCLEEAFSAEEHAGMTGLVEDSLRVLGQVVVDRATRSAWNALRKRLKQAAHCGDRPGAPYRLEFTCRALERPLPDLLANPDSLVDAAVADLFALSRHLIDGPIGAHQSRVGQRVARRMVDAIGGWQSNGLDGARDAFVARFYNDIIELSLSSSCPDAIPDAALWSVGQCVLEVERPRKFLSCDLEGILTRCAFGARELEQVRGVVYAGTQAVDPTWEGSPRAHAREKVNFLFELASLESRGEVETKTWDGFQDVFVGLLEDDWPRVTTGAVALVEVVGTRPSPVSVAQACPGQQDPSCRAKMAQTYNQDTRQFFEFLAGVALYARAERTKSGEGAAQARAAALASLTERLTSRTERAHPVVSLGGSFGVMGGWRAPIRRGQFSEGQISFPLHLGLGLGLDTYRPGGKRGGLHAEVTVFDLGQYVAFSNDSFAVQTPDLRAALATAVKLGGWFANREMPLYVAAFCGFSPFVPVVNEAQETVMTWQVGAMLGIYVPLFDLN